jgi:hypothetical protein
MAEPGLDAKRPREKKEIYRLRYPTLNAQYAFRMGQPWIVLRGTR